MSELEVALSDRYVNRLLNNPKALEEFPALKPYAKIRAKAIASRGRSCCRGRVSEREIIMGVKQLLLSSSPATRMRLKAFMGVPADCVLKVHELPPGQPPRTTRI